MTRDRGLRAFAARAVGVVVILILLVAVAVVSCTGSDPSQPESGPGAARSPQASRLSMEPAPPFSVVDTSPLRLPDDVRFAEGSFSLLAGGTYLVQFTLDTVKPESAPGIGMYVNVSFSCQQADGRGVGSIGGTENLVPGEPVTFANQLLLRPTDDGEYRCSVVASAPNDAVAAKGTTVELDAIWRVTEVDGRASQSDTSRTLPQTVEAGADSTPLESVIPLDDAARFDIRFTLHVTTCTGVNGSREAGRAWCSAPVIDERGSAVDVLLRTELLDGRGESCTVLAEERRQVHVDKWIHHDLVPIHVETEVPAAPCGTSARTTVTVRNEGPAALVLHESNTSLIVTTSQH